MCRVEGQNKILNVKIDKMQKEIDESRRCESRQWALSLDKHLYSFARLRRTTETYAVIDLCLSLPETTAFTNARSITVFHTVIFALNNNAELAFTVGTRE